MSQDHSRSAEELMTPSADDHDIPHLLAPVAMSRQVLAAYYLRECKHIVELGGHKAPITPFLMHGPESVVSCDPKINPVETDTLHGKPCRVRHLAAKFQQIEFDVEPYDYGLVILGYSLKPYGDQRPDDMQLFDLIDHAKVTVIDYVHDFERADTQLPQVLERGTLREVCHIDIKLHDDVIAGLPYANRRILVLEPTALGHK